eukprot:scaffold56226_cov66-Phaeocystis_antarctica.AAC.6
MICTETSFALPSGDSERSGDCVSWYAGPSLGLTSTPRRAFRTSDSLAGAPARPRSSALCTCTPRPHATPRHSSLPLAHAPSPVATTAA